MAETKITRKDMFNWAIAVLDDIDYTTDEEREMAATTKEMFVKYVAQLSKPAKPRVNKEAIEFAEAAKAVIENGNAEWTAKDLAAAMNVSSHKASAALRRLHKDGVVTLGEKAHKSDPNVYVRA